MFQINPIINEICTCLVKHLKSMINYERLNQPSKHINKDVFEHILNKLKDEEL